MKVRLLDLKPTQFAIGMLEVDEKAREVKKFSRRELKKFLRERIVPVIKSPHGELYLVDRHHFCAVCHQVGIEKVKVEIVKDFSKKRWSYRRFWQEMRRQKFIYPFCQFGEGPRSPIYLPHDIRCLADDPYRTLAWYVKKTGGFEKDADRNFVEFQWANFFRAQGLLDEHGPRELPAALKRAIKLAGSPKARHLPGYEPARPKKLKRAHSLAKHIQKKVGKPLDQAAKKRRP